MTSPCLGSSKPSRPPAAWRCVWPAVLPFLIGISACGPAGQDMAEKAEADGGARIACALAGAADFRPVCRVERSRDADGIVLTLHHPDGGFRRLRVTTDGRGVAAADGAEPARVSLSGDRRIEVAVADDRYRLPATIKPRVKP